jgi:hypothetical protein
MQAKLMVPSSAGISAGSDRGEHKTPNGVFLCLYKTESA